MRLRIALIAFIVTTTTHAWAKTNCKVGVDGVISDQTWFDLARNCERIGPSKDLIFIMKLDAVDAEYSNCSIGESQDSAGNILHRNCDQPQGFAVFVAPRSYCMKLIRMAKHSEK